MRIQNIIAVFILLSIGLKSQTTIGGSIFTSTTLIKANSPYIVTTNLVIFQGATVNVDPGVEIRMGNGIEIEVRGTLLLYGNTVDSIFIHSTQSPGGKSEWKQIFATSSGIVKAKYLKLSNADQGIMSVNYSTNVLYTNSVFFNNNYALNSIYGHPTGLIRDCDFHNNNNALGIGIYDNNLMIKKCKFYGNVNAIGSIMYNQQNIHMDSCTINNNTYGLNAWLDGWGGDVTNTNIYNNGTGLELYWLSTNHQFNNNKIYNNGLGVFLKAQSDPTFVNTYICNNTINNVELAYQNNVNIKNVCWCTNDSTAIRAKIKDGYVNNTLGLAFYSPFVTNCSFNMVGVNENSGEKEMFALYPNPSNNLVYIKQPDNMQNINLKIINAEGKNVLNFDDFTSDNINVSELQNGLYLIMITSNDKNFSYRFVKN